MEESINPSKRTTKKVDHYIRSFRNESCGFRRGDQLDTCFCSQNDCSRYIECGRTIPYSSIRTSRLGPGRGLEEEIDVLFKLGFVAPRITKPDCVVCVCVRVRVEQTTLHKP